METEAPQPPPSYYYDAHHAVDNNCCESLFVSVPFLLCSSLPTARGPVIGHRGLLCVVVLCHNLH